ncbi:UNVERIFIED_ORG: hypothetical protein QQG_5626, partial [Clostridioides difficile Y384]
MLIILLTKSSNRFLNIIAATQAIAIIKYFMKSNLLIIEIRMPPAIVIAEIKSIPLTSYMFF